MAKRSHWPSGWQRRGRYLWITRLSGEVTIWFNVGGRKPLAHLPRWKRRLFHPVPSIRWRLWPRPFRKSTGRVSL